MTKIGEVHAWEASESPGRPINVADDDAHTSIEIFTHGNEIIGLRVYNDGDIVWTWGYLPAEEGA